MRPYLAILVDSYWEAVGNRVLWALLCCWSVVIVCLCPFGLVAERSYELTSSDIINRDAILKQLIRAANGQGSASAKAVVKLLPTEFVEDLRNRNPDAPNDQNSGRISYSQIAEALNNLLDKRELYSEQSFPNAALRSTIKPLLEKPIDRLNTEQLEELNRKLLQQAFASELQTPRGEQIWIGYAGIKIGEPLGLDRRFLREIIESRVLAIIVKLGLGMAAVFVAIVVTSPIIPDTFRSGSLHLMLSKPISRSLLYLFKFFGGCIFVLINITFLICGLFLVVGWRFGIWNTGLLACIPLLMFVFIIFYSVSALVGIVWGNSVICVVACLVFWLFCAVVGALRSGFLPAAELTPQITRFHVVQDRLLAVTQGGALNIWNDQFSVWQPAVEMDYRRNGRILGPIFDQKRNQLLVRGDARTPFGMFWANSRKLSVVELTTDNQPDAIRNQTTRTRVPKTAEEAREKAYWTVEAGPEMPGLMMEFVQLGDEIIAVTRSEIKRLDWSKIELAEASEKLFFGFRPPVGQTDPFVTAMPNDYTIDETVSVAVAPNQQQLFVYHSGTLDLLELSAKTKKFTQVRSIKLDGVGSEAAILMANDAYCIIARDGLPLKILDYQLTEIGTALSLPNGADVRHLTRVPNSPLFSVITHSGEWYTLDPTTARIKSVASPIRAVFTAAFWLDTSRVWVAVKPHTAMLLNLGTGTIERQLSPAPSRLDWFYWWVANPLYYVNPKPAALDQAMSYLLTGKDTQSLEIVTTDLKTARVELEVWQPIVSNSLFVVLMLFLGCWYLIRKEF